MSGDNDLEFHTITEYNLNFIPYQDLDEIRWAVYDAKSDDDIDGTKFLAQAITSEIAGKDRYISKDRMAMLAETYNAQPILVSTHNNAVEELQSLLGDARDARKYLNRFGFTKGQRQGISLDDQLGDDLDNTEKEPKAPASSSKKNDSLSDSNDKEEDTEQEHSEAARQFNSAGSVPIDEEEEWRGTTAYKLLWKALVFKQQEIEDNVKGSMKELVSDGLAIYTTVTMPNGYSATASAMGAVAIGLMAYKAASDVKERNEILKDWALFINDLEDETVDKKTAHENLKRNMRNSSFAYEGVPDTVSFEQYRNAKPFFKKYAELQGHFDPPPALNADQVMSVGDRLRNTQKKTARMIGKNYYRTKHYSRVAGTGVKEVVTDLAGLFNPKNNTKRNEFKENIFGAGKVTAKDIRHTRGNRRAKKAEHAKHAANKRLVAHIEQDHKRIKDSIVKTPKGNIQKTPDVIHASINTKHFELHRETLEHIRAARKDKGFAEFNYTNVSVSMAAQSAGVVNGMMGMITGVINANPMAISQGASEIGTNAYGIFSGIGAYSQAGSNVLTIDDKLHGHLAEEAKRHEYVKNIAAERLQENVESQHLIPEDNEPV